MRKKIEDLLERVDQFDDSEILAIQLQKMADNSEIAIERYYLKESSDHICGLWMLVCDIRFELEKLNKSKVTA